MLRLLLVLLVVLVVLVVLLLDGIVQVSCARRGEAAS